MEEKESLGHPSRQGERSGRQEREKPRQRKTGRHGLGGEKDRGGCVSGTGVWDSVMGWRE